jgi:hypothetical protein
MNVTQKCLYLKYTLLELVLNKYDEGCPFLAC